MVAEHGLVQQFVFGWHLKAVGFGAGSFAPSTSIAFGQVDEHTHALVRSLVRL
jgi:hypothetical protein